MGVLNDAVQLTAELQRARRLLSTVYVFDDQDKQAIDEAKSALAKASSEISRLQGK